MAKKKAPNLATGSPRDALLELAEALSLTPPDVLDLLRAKHGQAVDDLLSIAPTPPRAPMPVPNMRGAREPIWPGPERPMGLLPPSADEVAARAQAPIDERFNQTREEVRAARRQTGFDMRRRIDAASRDAAGRLSGAGAGARDAEARMLADRVLARGVKRRGVMEAFSKPGRLTGVSKLEAHRLLKQGGKGALKLAGKRALGLALGPVGTIVGGAMLVSDLVGDANEQQMQGLLTDMQRGAESVRRVEAVGDERRLETLEGYSSAMLDLAHQRERGRGLSGLSPELQAIVAGETARLASMQQPARVGAAQAIAMAEGFNAGW